MVLKDLCKCKKLINPHLLTVKDYQNFRVMSGRYLPPVAIGMCGLAFDFYFMQSLVTCGVVSHGLYSKSVDVSIYQLKVCFNSTKLKSVLKDFSSNPIKSMMAFVSPGCNRRRTYAKGAVTTFRTLVQSVQTEPIISAGVTVDMTVLLPEQYMCDCDFDTTIIVFRGEGLNVTSDIFEWIDTGVDRFISFITKLLDKAGPAPVDGTRVIYIFECYRVKNELLKNVKQLLNLSPGVEIVFIRSKYNEFYYNTHDTTRESESDNCDIRTYSTIVNVYDFLNVSKTSHKVTTSVESTMENDPDDPVARKTCSETSGADGESHQEVS
ncbi:uncharacterized protein LOC103510517 isoform X2 [Diaphorina citri]|nr:uncharacterized protein LOC103510517 isoform X2 [Diaphorina citri]